VGAKVMFFFGNAKCCFSFVRGALVKCVLFAPKPMRNLPMPSFICLEAVHACGICRACVGVVPADCECVVVAVGFFDDDDGGDAVVVVGEA